MSVVQQIQYGDFFDVPTFYHPQTWTERTGQYKMKGLGWTRTSANAACVGSHLIQALVL